MTTSVIQQTGWWDCEKVKRWAVRTSTVLGCRIAIQLGYLDFMVGCSCRIIFYVFDFWGMCKIHSKSALQQDVYGWIISPGLLVWFFLSTSPESWGTVSYFGSFMKVFSSMNTCSCDALTVCSFSTFLEFRREWWYFTINNRNSHQLIKE